MDDPSSPSQPSTSREQRAPFETLARSHSRIQLTQSQSELLQKGYFTLKMARELKYVSRECKQLFESVGSKSIAKTDLSKSYKFLYEIMCATNCQKVFSDCPSVSRHPSVDPVRFKINRYLNIVRGLLDNWLLLERGRLRTNVEVRQMALAIYSDLVYLAGERINKYYFEFDDQWIKEYQERCQQLSITFLNVKISYRKPKEEIQFYPTTTILYVKNEIDIASHQNIVKFIFGKSDCMPRAIDTDDDWKDCYLADLLSKPLRPGSSNSSSSGGSSTSTKLNPDDCNCKFDIFSKIANKFCPNCGDTDEIQYFHPGYANFLRNHTPEESNSK